MNAFYKSAGWLVALTAAMAFGCARTPAPVAAPAPTVAAIASTTTYNLEGEVRSINAENGLVTIRHKEIPGFMGAMTMRFAVASPQIIAGVVPGMHIRFTLQQGDDDLIVTSVTILPATSRAQGSGGADETSQAVLESPPAEA